MTESHETFMESLAVEAFARVVRPPGRRKSKAVEPEASGAILSPELHAAIAESWRSTWSLLFGREWVYNLAQHHVRTIRWHWAARHRICRGEKPWRDYYADFPMWSRGHAKSTIARRLAVMDAILELFYGRTGYCLYFSGTDAKTEKHAKSILLLLQSAELRQHAPLLTQVRRTDEGSQSLGWKATLLYTASGHVFHFGSLQSGLAGGNIDDVRPTMLIPDDIDDRLNSPVIAEKNFQLFTREILPMGAKGTLTLWAQNLINRYSAMYRIHKGHARVLTNRRPSDPVPAIKGLKTELRVAQTGGKTIVQDVITAGVATWPEVMPIEECQDELNRVGLPAFLAECQHEVEGTREKAMLHVYRDEVHVISVSEFEAMMGEKWMPKHWTKEWANDWARTKTKFHANVSIWRTVSPRGSKWPGFLFYGHAKSYKPNAQPEDVAESVLSALDPHAIRRSPPAKSPTWAELRRDELLRLNALEHVDTALDRMKFEREALARLIPQYSEAVLREHRVLGGVMSHERDDVREIFNGVYALMAIGVNPGKFGGIEAINRSLAIDPEAEHPARPGIKGFTRTFFVVPDDPEARGEVRAGILVRPPKPYPVALTPEDLVDDDLMRYQLVNWELQEAKLIESGEKVDEPFKANDDFGNAIQMMEYNGSLDNDDESPQAEYRQLVPDHMKPPKIGEEEGRVFTMQDQQALGIAAWKAKMDLVEKYGEDVVEELDDEWWRIPGPDE